MLEQKRGAEQELSELGTPPLGQTTNELGYQHPRLAAPGPTPAWLQIDLENSEPIDWVALFPAQVDWQSSERPAYGFPRRFRLDLSDDPAFASFHTIANFSDADFPDPGVAPVSVPAGGRKARFVRLTVNKLATENGQFFYALAEMMVLSGPRNVAISKPVSASDKIEVPPRWAVKNLVDGRTPLGPPIRRKILDYDGLFAGKAPDGSMPWMCLDLGRALPLQEVRIYPVHARIGADIPGFAFPETFRVEISQNPDFNPAETLWESAAYPNPGNNALTIAGGDREARYLRVVLVEDLPRMGRRFGLSEIEVYSQSRNVARQATVTSTADSSTFSKNWPRALLVDGYTSYGQLIELPDWLQTWNRRRELRAVLEQLTQRQAKLEALVQQRLRWAGAALALVILASSLGLWALAQRRRQAEMNALRLRLARDLHDEIGSNLAGIAVLSELAPASDPSQTRADWLEVNRVARDTIDSMREVIWLLDSKEQADIDLLAHLQLAVSRLLPGRQVRWLHLPERLPANWPAAARRHLFLFFKEALANIVRHAGPASVELSLQILDSQLLLEIHDDGCGFDPSSSRKGGLGLASMRERARQLHGRLSIDSAPGKGCRLRLSVPL